MSESSNTGSTNTRSKNYSYKKSVYLQACDAIVAGNMEQLYELLTKDDVTDDNINRALQAATGQLNNLDACRVIICNIVLASPRKDFFITNILFPLHTACIWRRVEILTYLLSLSIFDVNGTRFGDEFGGGDGTTALYHAIKPCTYPQDTTNNDIVEATRLLIENGANPNKGRIPEHYKGVECPLYVAVFHNNTDIVRLLLQHGADPNHVEYTTMQQRHAFVTRAIKLGNAEILDMLLEHGAIVVEGEEATIPNPRPSSFTTLTSTSLNDLLLNAHQSRKTKLAICRVLVNHAHPKSNIAAFLQSTLEFDIALYHMVACEILLEAGMVPRSTSRAFYIAIRSEEGGRVSAARLLLRYGADPFSQEEQGDSAFVNTHNDFILGGARSPFHAAARLHDTSILRLFLEHWNDERFSSIGRRVNNCGNNGGDSAIHVLCRDPRVSIQAIKLLVEEFKANVSEAAPASPTTRSSGDGEQQHHRCGLLPFHSAVLTMADAPDHNMNLDVVFFLLRQHPDALTTRY